MIIEAKSSTFLKPKELKTLLKDCCPLRLFKHINIVDSKEGLCYCYRMPSKAKLDLSITRPISKDLIPYLLDNQLRLNNLAEQQWLINDLRQLQLDARNSIKEFVGQLSAEELEKYNPRLSVLMDSIGVQCVPHMTRTINQNWNSIIREPVFKTIKAVRL